MSGSKESPDPSFYSFSYNILENENNHVATVEICLLHSFFPKNSFVGKWKSDADSNNTLIFTWTMNLIFHFPL